MDTDGDGELDNRAKPTTVRLRPEHLSLIKIAADKMGMPYQTYVRAAAIRQAINDLLLVKGLSQVGTTEPTESTV